MSFDREHLPEATAYFEGQGLRLSQRGKWRTTACRFHGGSDSMRINVQTGGWCCMACGRHGSDVLSYHQQAHDLEFIEGARELGAWIEDGKPGDRPESRKARSRGQSRDQDMLRHPRLCGWGWGIWRASTGLPGTIGAQYLAARCCALPPADGHLRFHPQLEHPSGYAGPALVALVTDAVTSEPLSLHRTWIKADGTKAEVEPARLVLPGHRKQGGVIRLWPDDTVTYGLGIAEGIESALSLATALRPVWSCMDAGNMSKFPVLGGIELLTIAADNDAAGINAAEACAMRWTEVDRDVRVVIPPAEGTDLNDVARMEVG